MARSINELTRTAETIHPNLTWSNRWVQAVEQLENPQAFLKHAQQVLESELSEGFFQPKHYKKTVSQKDDFPYSHCRLMSEMLGQVFSDRVMDTDRTSRFMSLSDDQVDSTVSQLREDGLSVLPVRMSEQNLELIRRELSQRDYINRMSKTVQRGVDEQTPDANGTWWIQDEAELASIEVLQRLAFDPFILRIVQGALHTIPIHVQTNAWWTFPLKVVAGTDEEKTQKRNAQWFHQDMEFIDFVKVFVYLTDVGPSNGPHVYVAGSANDYEDRLPGVAVSSRVSDDDVERAFGTDRVKQITGPAGLIAIENTRGYHKGTPAIEGCRCILQIEYACSMFFNPVNAFNVAALDDEHQALMRQYPRMFMNYRDPASKAERSWWPWPRRRAA